MTPGGPRDPFIGTETGSAVAPRRVYLDHQATTPVAPEVVAAMAPYWSDQFGNASSGDHSFGWSAAAAVERAREQLAALLGCRVDEVFFTSGATESNNLALLGMARTLRDRGRHIIAAPTEHESVLGPLEALRNEGFEVSWLSVDAAGRVDLDEALALCRRETILVTLMWANNEIGTVHPIAPWAEAFADRGIALHCDGVQGLGLLPLHLDSLKVTTWAFSGHKIYGPKGVGALVHRRVRPPLPLAPVLFGGGHERGRRPGSLNVPAIVGFGAAADLIRCRTVEREGEHHRTLRNALWHHLKRHIPHASLHGPPLEDPARLPHCLNVALPVAAATLFGRCPQVAVSRGAACASGTGDRSHVLKALGLQNDEIDRSIRLSPGRYTSLSDVVEAAECLASAVANGQPSDYPAGTAGLDR